MADFPRFLDFEASSLSDTSYPIEVAWNEPDGNVQSFLISPQTVTGWTDWSSASQQIHQIPREELFASGKSPAWVCARMRDALDGQVLFTDSIRFDGFWLSRLFTAAGEPPAFTLASSTDLIVKRLSPTVRGRARALARLGELEVGARSRVPQAHRAAWDVNYLLELWKLVDQAAR